MWELRRVDRRIEKHDALLVGYCEVCLERSALRADHTRFLVATSTFPGLLEVSVFIEAPIIVGRAFAKLVPEYLEGRLRTLRPSVVFYTVEHYMMWVDILLKNNPVTRRHGAAMAIREATAAIGGEPLEIEYFGRGDEE